MKLKYKCNTCGCLSDHLINNSICTKCYYKTHIVIKKCQKCNNIFNGTYHKKLCENCSKEKQNYNFKGTHKITTICSDCSILIKETIKNNTNKIKHDIITYKKCKTCKSIFLSNYQKLNNSNTKHIFKNIKQYNLYKLEKEVLKHKNRLERNLKLYEKLKTLNIDVSKYNFINLTEEYNSMRMLLNNPMFDSKTAQKVGNTIKQKIETGEIKYSAKNRKTYTGCSRSIQNYLRIELSDWKMKLMKEQNFHCSICHCKPNMLHIHHIIPFREILKNICEELGLKYESLKEIKHLDDTYLKIKEKLLYYHYNNDCGIVVCPVCHSKIDEHYHLEKKYENSEN